MVSFAAYVAFSPLSIASANPLPTDLLTCSIVKFLTMTRIVGLYLVGYLAHFLCDGLVSGWRRVNVPLRALKWFDERSC